MSYADPPIFSANVLQAFGRGVLFQQWDTLSMEKPMKSDPPPTPIPPGGPSILETALEQKVSEEAAFQLDAVQTLRQHLTAYEATIKQEIRQKTLATMLEAIGAKPPPSPASTSDQQALKDALRTLLEHLGGFQKV